MKVLPLLCLLAASALAQQGLTITGGHPRIYFDPTRLAAAQADFATHPWTPTSISITNAGSWAAHSIITSTPSECTSAIAAVVAFTINLSGFALGAGAATTSDDNMRWNGENVAEVYDWCYPQLSVSDAQLLRDRWAGTTASPSDPVHTPTDLARANLTGIVTSAQSPFLPNMAGNNLLVYDSTVPGVSCPNERFPILGYIDANTVFVGGRDVSTTTVAVGTGSKTFTVRFGATYAAGTTIRVINSTDQTKTMEGTVTSSTSSSLVLNVTATTGSGSASSWEVNPNGYTSSGCKARVSGYTDVSRQNAWGGPTMPYNNYFWGFWRNDILFGVAFSGESAYSADLLADAFGLRWTNALAYFTGIAPYTASSALGGLWAEGTEYGAVNFYYKLLPLLVCQRYGRDLTQETNWFRESGVFTMYNTTLKPTSNQNGALYPQMFAWGDDQNLSGYPSAMTTISTTGYSAANAFIYGYSDVVLHYAQVFTGNLGKYFRQYVQNTAAVKVPWFAATDPGGTALPLTGLPLDYYVDGVGTLFTKNTWATTGTQVKVSGIIDIGGHSHVQSGDFAIQRNGVWLSKEFTVYQGAGAEASVVCAYSNTSSSPIPGTTCDGRYGYAHNTLTLGPAAPTGCNTAMTWAHPDGQASITRLESRANYSYMVADLTITYRAGADGDIHACRDHNPYSGTVQREYLFVKPLETLIIFDRIQSADNYLSPNLHPVITPATTVKTVLIHSPVAPTISTNTATWDNQGQRLKGWFFGPATIDLANVDEGNFLGHKVNPNWYQQRLEFSNTTDVSNSVAAAQSYMVSVLRAGDTSGWQDFTTATLVDNGSTFTLTLEQPTAGNMVWVITKGSTSTGGTFGYAASGTPSPTDLSTSVLKPTVSDSGIVWATAPRIPGLFYLPNSLYR